MALNLEHEYFNESDITFKKDQLWKWVCVEIGLNPLLNRIDSLCFDSTYKKRNLLHLLAQRPSSPPFRVSVDVVVISACNLEEETFQLLLHLKLRFSPAQDSYHLFLSDGHRLLLNIFMGSYDIDNLGDSEMKASYSEDSLMISSSTDCGYHIERGRTSSDLKKSILRESCRLGLDLLRFRFDSYFECLDNRTKYDIPRSERYLNLLECFFIRFS